MTHFPRKRWRFLKKKNKILQQQERAPLVKLEDEDEGEADDVFPG